MHREMAVASLVSVPIEEDGLQFLGGGGFGSVYKAKHKVLQIPVAIKWLHNGSCASVPSVLLQEAGSMKESACLFVVMVYGTYMGCPPKTTSVQQGIVMEFMEGGTIESLQKDLGGPPPLPLVFRLAGDVARGMNFLHSKGFVHHDLKPSNVLLDKDLNAKIADFGLCRVSTSVLPKSIETSEMKGGTYKYMPPEAVKESYEPVRNFDIFSYGILLWSIITGKEPYPAVQGFSHYCAMIGDEKCRPLVEDIDQSTAEGLGDLVDLMKRCWQGMPSRRPDFEECIKVTDRVFEKHKTGIKRVVMEVWEKRNPATNDQLPNASLPRVRLQPAEQSEDTVDSPRLEAAEGSSKKFFPQKSVDSFAGKKSDAEKMNDADKAAFVTKKMADIVRQMSRVMKVVDELGDIVSTEDYDKIRATRPDQKKVRELYRLCFRSEGVKVKAAFFDALKKHQPVLMEELGG